MELNSAVPEGNVAKLLRVTETQAFEHNRCKGEQ